MLCRPFFIKGFCRGACLLEERVDQPTFYRLVVERLEPISYDRAVLCQTLLPATSFGHTVGSELAAICGRADAVGTTLSSAHPRSNAFCKKAVLLVNGALAALRIRASA